MALAKFRFNYVELGDKRYLIRRYLLDIYWTFTVLASSSPDYWQGHWVNPLPRMILHTTLYQRAMTQNFDREQLEQLAGGDAAFEKELLRLFVGDTQASLEQLAMAIDTENQAVVQELAHYIKGASANVGAVGMSKAAAQLEMSAKMGNLRGAPKSLRQLQTLHRDVQRLAR